MDIQKAMKDYQTHFNAYYSQFGSKIPVEKKKLERPNFLQEVINPLLNALPEAMPGYNFVPPPADYSMYGEYYRIKGGIILYGGLSIGDNFELFFTPLFHGQPIGEPVEISTLNQLVGILQSIYKQRKEQG